MKAIIMCASNKSCANSKELEVLLGPLCDVDHDEPVPLPSASDLVHRDFDTHDQLHKILRRGSTTGGVARRVEISVECGDDMGHWHGSLAIWCWNFYSWVESTGKTMCEAEKEELRITFRVMPIGDKVRACLDSEENPFVDDEFTESFWEGRAWRCAVGEEVEEKEVAKWWREGEM